MESKKIGIVYKAENLEQVLEIKKKLEENDCEIKEIEIKDEEEKPNNQEPNDEQDNEIEELIDWLDDLIILIDNDTHSDLQVESEIEEAYKRGKTIIGIFAKGCDGSTALPYNFKKYRNYTLGTDSIDKLDKILEKINIPHEQPNGTESAQTYRPHRVVCK